MNHNNLVKKTYRTLLALAGAAMIACLPVAAEATIIPDITSSGDLSSGWANDTFTDKGTTPSWTQVSFLDAGNSPGTFAFDTYTGGNVLMTGVFSYDHDYTGILLQGLITKVTTLGTGDYNIYFSIDAGSALKAMYGDFGMIHANMSTRTADTTKASAPVPEPATMSLLLTGVSGLVAVRRRRHQAAAA